jgi:hypothetical protein
MNFHPENTTQLAGIALVEVMQQPAFVGKEGMKSRSASFQNIDNDCAAPTPYNFHRTTDAEISKTLDLESGPINRPKAPSIEELLEPENTRNEGGRNTTNSNANLAVATPVMDEADFDSPTYDATPYHMKQRRRFTNQEVYVRDTCFVSVTVTSVVRKTVDPPSVEYVIKEPTLSPTLSPTSPRDD